MQYLKNIKSHFDELKDSFDLESSLIISNDISKKLKLSIDDTVTIFFQMIRQYLEN